ncbi:MAG: hypothetical protein ACX93T_00075 [Bacteroidota bacterium]
MLTCGMRIRDTQHQYTSQDLKTTYAGSVGPALSWYKIFFECSNVSHHHAKAVAIRMGFGLRQGH